MPITNCPECNQRLEVPPVVPGGYVACPYCATEFAVGGGGGGPVRGRSGAGRRAPRRGGRDDDGDDDDNGRFRHRRRGSDMTPIIVVLVGLLVFGGVALFFYLRSQKAVAQEEAERLASIAAAPPQRVEFERVPDNPTGDPMTFLNRFVEGDRIQLRTFSISSSLSRDDLEAPIFDLTFTAESDRDAERVTALDGEHATHVGTYTVKSYIQDGQFLISEPTEIEAEFKTDRLGNLVPGSFRQTGGTTLSPPMEILGDRGFGILPEHPIRLAPTGVAGQPGETWGTDGLPDPISNRLMIGNTTFANIPLVGPRLGGWRQEGGLLSRDPDRSFDRRASLTLNLSAAENRFLRNGTFEGRPAEISGFVNWSGEVTYMLKKGLMVKARAVNVLVKARVKLKKKIINWTGSHTLNYEITKDP
jgi:hypothetical protein